VDFDMAGEAFSHAGRDLFLTRWPHIRGHFYFV